MNFQEASEVAKRNPGSILSRDESGEFYVRGPNGEPVGAKPLPPRGLAHESKEGKTRVAQLEQELSKLRLHMNAEIASQLKEKETRIAQLEQELSKLQLHIDAEIESRLKPRQESIDAAWADVQKEKFQLKQQVAQTERQLGKLRLLEAAYSERFGAAEVKEIEVTVDSREICSRCGGDGGINGGCGKCDGTGWTISQRQITREEVQFKSNPPDL